MDVVKVQTKLNLAGANIQADGDLGPKTFTAILNFVVGRNLGSLGVILGRSMAVEFKKYGITSDLRIAHFIAQAAHETGGFKYLSELGSGKDVNHDGFDDYLQKYDFRKDLGNSHVGDGPKFRGRGIFQLTGYFNYLNYGNRLGLSLTSTPDMAAQPDIAVVTACLFWNDKGLSNFADKDDVLSITKKINGGTNGLAERTQYAVKLKGLFA